MHNRYWYLLSKKLSGNATDHELTEMDELVKQNPDWHYATQHLHNIWEQQSAEPAVEEDFSNHLNRMEALGHDTTGFRDTTGAASVPLLRSYKKKRLLVAGIAILLLIAVIAGLGVFSDKQIGTHDHNTYNKIITQSGDRRKINLPDGTKVWLNAESTLEYNRAYGKTNRSISLNGEAYFEVVKNSALPFILQTNKINIKVTGTAFNVKSYGREQVAETSLIRGKVEITVNARPEEKYILKPNEKLVVRDESIDLVTNKSTLPVPGKKAVNEPLIQLGYVNFINDESTAVETSWVYNKLILDNETLSEIAKKMERWYGVTININNNEVAAQHLTYTIKNETIAQALQNMQYAVRFHYTISGKNVTITK